MRRIKVVILTTTILIFLALLGSKTAFVLEEENYNPNNLLRLHVIADSNSLADQALKREIRDEIIKESKGLFNNITDISQASDIVIENLDYLEQVVQSKVREEGKDYKIQIKVGEFYFPTRTYGDVTLPKGDYQAVRVVIGEGNGANWWCVLFPPLCFVDSVDKASPEVIKAMAQEDDTTKLNVKFKFKLVEYLKKHPQWDGKRLNLAKILSFID